MEQSIEQEIQDKGLTAPRITRVDIEAEIAAEHCFTAMEGVCGNDVIHGRGRPLANIPGARQLGLLTICVLVLKNGFTVTGTSACVSPENFDPDIGRKVAREDAIDKIWPLLGFRLRDRLNMARNLS